MSLSQRLSGSLGLGGNDPDPETVPWLPDNLVDRQIDGPPAASLEEWTARHNPPLDETGHQRHLDLKTIHELTGGPIVRAGEVVPPQPA